MANMSYCRFENTSSDLSDCLYALKYEFEDISPNEKDWAKRMYEQCKEFVEVWEEQNEEE